MTPEEPTPAREVLTPAERALVDRLEDVRDQAVPADPALARSVVRTARWQHVLRAPLSFFGLLAGAAGDGVAALAGVRRGRRR